MKTNELILASKNIFEEVLKQDGVKEELKETIKSYLGYVDEELTNNPNLIVVYTTKGEGLTKDMLIERVGKIEGEIRSGKMETLSHQEVLEKIKSWG